MTFTCPQKVLLTKFGRMTSPYTWTRVHEFLFRVLNLWKCTKWWVWLETLGKCWCHRGCCHDSRLGWVGYKPNWCVNDGWFPSPSCILGEHNVTAGQDIWLEQYLASGFSSSPTRQSEFKLHELQCTSNWDHSHDICNIATTA